MTGWRVARELISPRMVEWFTGRIADALKKYALLEGASVVQPYKS